MTSDQRYARLVRALTSEADVSYEPPTTGRRSFGSGALKVGGKIFAMQVEDRLVVKLPRARVDALVDTGHGDRFDPGHGRVMKEWFVLAGTSSLRWRALADEALAYVRG